MKRFVFFFTTLVFGLVLRMFLATYAYRELIFDTKTYVEFAQLFLNGQFPIDCCTKSMGYPMLLAILFWIRGSLDIEFVKFIQILLDVGAGILIWTAARRVFAQKTANFAFLLYMVNPFTSSYVGFLLPEALSCFLVGMLLVLVTAKRFRNSMFIWFVFGATLGFFLFVRLSFFILAPALVVFLSLVYFKKERYKFLMMSCFGFLLISSYSLLLNYQTYRKISIIPPYVMKGIHLYLTFFIDRYPEVEFLGIDPEVTRVFEEYRLTPFERKDSLNSRYTQKFIDELLHEPQRFIWQYIRNIFWIWDKDHLFVYADPWYPADRWVLRVVNLFLLGIGGWGMIAYVKKGIHRLREPFVLLTLLMAFVISFIFPLTSSESRHSIVFYPLLFFWVAFGITKIVRL